VFDEQELADYVAGHPQVFPPDEYSHERPALAWPEQIPAVAQRLV
jgi:hypothetical protein